MIQRKFSNAFEKLSQTWQASSLPDFGNIDLSFGGYENVSGGRNDISRGRKNEAIDDTDERKKRKKKKKQTVYHMS